MRCADGKCIQRSSAPVLSDDKDFWIFVCGACDCTTRVNRDTGAVSYDDGGSVPVASHGAHSDVMAATVATPSNVVAHQTAETVR